MRVEIYQEAGYEHAARAVRLSRRSQGQSDSTGAVLGPADRELFKKLLSADDTVDGQPHSVGLRQVVFWIGVKAPLYWWKQMDRYVVGKDQASDSTMYNLMNEPLAMSDFAEGVNIATVFLVNHYVEAGDFARANANLPISYLQERSLMISLPPLRRIISQRKNHKLPEWRFFVEEILNQAMYPDLLGG